MAAVLGFVVLVTLGFIWRMNQPVQMSAADLRINGAIELSTPRIFSDFKLARPSRRAVYPRRPSRAGGRILFFGFTNCPDICPTTMATLAEMYQDLGESEKEKLQIVMISLDPERDTVEKMADYVPYFNQDFIGVTGDPNFVLRLTTQLNVAYTQVPLEDDQLHG